VSSRSNAPLKRERLFLKLAELTNLPPPLVELRKALMNVKDEVEKDAAVVAALVLYKTLVKNAEAYGEWARWYDWARGLVEKREFTVAASDIKRLRGAQSRLEEVAEEVMRELNSVLTLYKSHSRDLYERLRPYLEVDVEKVKKAEELAEASYRRFLDYSDAGMGTKAYAALLSIARGGLYGHVAMLLMGEGALADIILSTPGGAYEKADRVAKERGEAVDPSYSRRRGRSVGQPSWEDRAASVLLRFLIRYGEADLKFRRVEKGDRKGFQVFRIYGGVEAFVGELWIGKSTARFKVSKEGPRRLVEEAERTAPDLSGIKKIWQTLEWLNTDVSFDRGWIVAATADTRQAAWYVALFGEPESISDGGASVTEEGIKPNVQMRWRRERLDRIIAEEGEELEPLLGRTVKSWRELVDAVDWSWVLKRIEELADELKPWIGPERANNVEREGLARRMLGGLELLVHFAEARRGKDDSRWREERAKRLAGAVETLSNGRIAGKYAERLARAIIRYAEERKKDAKKRIENITGKVGVSREEAWGIVEFILSDMYCLARDCADDKIIRKFVAPALKLIMLDKALRGEFNRERTKLLFGEMYATALAGNGHVGPGEVGLTVGGELGGGAALLRLATLHLLNQLLSDELKFYARIYVDEGVYYIAARGENAARFKSLLAVSAPSAGGEYLSEKFNGFVEAAQVEVQLDENSIRLTDGGNVAADLTISEGGVDVKYNVYLRKDHILLRFVSTDRNRVELAARLLKRAGVSAEVTKEGGKDVWCIKATTDVLAAGRKELREAVRKVVEEALEKGWVDKKKAELWLEKLESGLTLMEGWPKYYVGLARSGALVVRFASPNLDSIQQVARRLNEIGLVEVEHFSMKMPEEGRDGYVRILREGLAYVAWLSEHGSGRQRELVAEFVDYILQRAKEKGEKVYEKAREIVEKGKARGSLRLEGLERKVEVNGKEHVVKVIGWGAELEKSQSGKKLLKIRITAEINNVKSDYTITFSRYGRTNTAEGRAYARSDTPEVREADAERYSALIKALTGKEPNVYRMKDGRIKIACYREHLDGFKRFVELADAIEKWLEETER